MRTYQLKEMEVGMFTQLVNKKPDDSAMCRLLKNTVDSTSKRLTSLSEGYSLLAQKYQDISKELTFYQNVCRMNGSEQVTHLQEQVMAKDNQISILKSQVEQLVKSDNL